MLIIIAVIMTSKQINVKLIIICLYTMTNILFMKQALVLLKTME